MIVAVYSREPGFSAEDQRPGAARATIAGWLVDYVGDLPSEAEVVSLMTPQNAEIDAQIKALEVKQVRLLTPSADRDFRLAVFVLAGMTESPTYLALKAIDEQIKDLMAQRQ